MKKQIIEEAIYLTHQCVAHFWQNDLSFAEALFSKNIMWIGALQKEFIQGREVVVEELWGELWNTLKKTLIYQRF